MLNRIDTDKIKDNISLYIEWSLYLLIFSLPFSKTLIEITATFAITLWIIKRLLMGREGVRFPYTELNLPLFTFVIINFLSIFWSTYFGLSVKAFIRKLLEYLLLYFVVVDTVREKRVVKNIFKATAIALFITILDCSYQKYVGYDFIRGYPMLSLVSITGPFNFPNGLSAWLPITIFPFISIMLFYPTRKGKADIIRGENRLLLKAICYILAIFSIWCLYSTHTRGGIISFIITLIFMISLTKKRMYIIVAFVLIAVLCLFALVGPEKSDSYKGVKYYIGLSELFSGISSQHRIRMWIAAWRMFIDRPFRGQGLNTFMANYPKFKIPDKAIGTWYAHNCYLQIAAETGIFGLISFLWLIWRMAIGSIKSWRLIDDDFLRYIYLGLFCGIVSYLIQSFVETNLYSLKLAVLFYFSLGFLIGIKRIAKVAPV